MSEEKKDEKITAVAKKEATAVVSEKTNWARMHGSWKERIERMLPEPAMIDQFLYCAEVQYGKNKEGFERCTPVSLLNCMMVCAKYGILPDGRNAYLIPYGNECTLQFDYKGLVHIVHRDGLVVKVHCETVCANDKFIWENNQVKLHEISLPRGQMLGVYCDLTLSNGEHKYELMDLDDIETVKSCSPSSKNPASPWNKFYKEMAKKSVFRRATKWLKLSPDVMDAIKADDDGGYDFNNLNAAKSGVKTLFNQDDTPKTVPPAKEDTVDVTVETVGKEIEKKKDEEETAKAKSGLPF
jgi:recombination protein RecT